MMENFLLNIFVLIIPGVLILINGIRMVKGSSKGWYFSMNLYAGGICYSQIPLGIAILSFSVTSIFQSEDIGIVFAYIATGFCLIALIFNFWQPIFLKPVWLKALIYEYGDFVYILAHEARAMDLNIWEKQMQTQADLEQWAKQIWDNHNAQNRSR